MGQRLDLHVVLTGVLGTSNVYFQPPASVQMVYPCIVYKWDNAKTEFAGNNPYANYKRYMVTVIDRNPDSGIPDKVAELPTCIVNRIFTKDNLHHSVFTLYF